MRLDQHPTLDAILRSYAGVIGDDFTAYRNHVYRVANLCLLFARCDDQRLETVAIAAACHDLGIWTHRTFDYLSPSISCAHAYLNEIRRHDLADEVATIIREHHKITRYHPHPSWLVEPFRRADWVDVTIGVRRFGLPMSVVRELYARWPGAGFHRLLVRLSLRRARSCPWSPLPMLRF